MLKAHLPKLDGAKCRFFIRFQTGKHISQSKGQAALVVAKADAMAVLIPQ
jgi:hypothetical protein